MKRQIGNFINFKILLDFWLKFLNLKYENPNKFIIKNGNKAYK